tara:strand:+ start:8142 stop:8402 length:261 start_codon:yes stop_codon:yes gene_type:complete
METLELVAMQIFNNKDNMTSGLYLELMGDLKDYYDLINDNPLTFESDDKIQDGEEDSDEDLGQDLSYSNYYQDDDDGYLSDYIESY